MQTCNKSLLKAINDVHEKVNLCICRVILLYVTQFCNFPRFEIESSTEKAHTKSGPLPKTISFFFKAYYNSVKTKENCYATLNYPFARR